MERNGSPPGVLERRAAGGAEAGEEFGQLARDHRRRVRARQVRAERGADALLQRQCLAERRQPAGQRCRILREEADQLTAGALRAEVARAPVAERRGLDLEQLRAGRARDRGRAVARARVDDQHLEPGLLVQHRGEHLLEVPRTVLDRDDDRGAAAHPEQLALGRLDAPHDAARDPDGGAELRGAGLFHQRVEVDPPAVEPVDLLLGLGQRGLEPAELLGALGLERGHPRPQGVQLGALVGGQRFGGHRFSATFGASRTKAHRPSANVTSTNPIGIRSSAALPISSAAVGAPESITAWRIWVRTTAIGLSM